MRIVVSVLMPMVLENHPRSWYLSLRHMFLSAYETRTEYRGPASEPRRTVAPIRYSEISRQSWRSAGR